MTVGARLRVASCVLCFLLSITLHADYQAGLDAYRAADYDRAFVEWMKVAESPPEVVHPAVRAESFYAIGMLYWMGHGVLQDSAASAHWLRQAADLQHAGAQTKLGYLYSAGQGVPQSDYSAFKYFRMAAMQGDPDAQYNLGVLYQQGLGVTADGNEALKWFREAAVNGDSESARIVAQYEAGVPEGSGHDPRAAQLPPEPAIQIDHVEDMSLGGESQNAASAVAESVVPQDIPSSSDEVMGDAWIEQRNPEHYTIQVIALREPDKLVQFITRHGDWSPFAIYQQTLKGKPVHIMVQGDYSDIVRARDAVRRFPPGIEQRDALWIRRFAMIQSSLQ